MLLISYLRWFTHWNLFVLVVRWIIHKCEMTSYIIGSKQSNHFIANQLNTLFIIIHQQQQQQFKDFSCTVSETTLYRKFSHEHCPSLASCACPCEHIWFFLKFSLWSERRRRRRKKRNRDKCYLSVKKYHE